MAHKTFTCMLAVATVVVLAAFMVIPDILAYESAHIVAQRVKAQEDCRARELATFQAKLKAKEIDFATFQAAKNQVGRKCSKEVEAMRFDQPPEPDSVTTPSRPVTDDTLPDQNGPQGDARDESCRSMGAIASDGKGGCACPGGAVYKKDRGCVCRTQFLGWWPFRLGSDHILRRGEQCGWWDLDLNDPEVQKSQAEAAKAGGGGDILGKVKTCRETGGTAFDVKTHKCSCPMNAINAQIGTYHEFWCMCPEGYTSSGGPKGSKNQPVVGCYPVKETIEPINVIAGIEG